MCVQTETGWTICGNPLGFQKVPIKPGSASVPQPGYDVRILDDGGQELKSGQQGNIVVKLPLPPSALHTIWNNPERAKKSYFDRFPGFYDTADGGFRDEDGYMFIMGRNDDVLNVAGHRLSTGQLEEAAAHHPDVAEVAVVARPDPLKGEVPLVVAVLKTGASHDHATIESDIVKRIRHDVGAVASVHRVLFVAKLPKTRSGKVLRATMRAQLRGETPTIPSTIEDASVLDDIKHVFTTANVITRPL